MKELIQIGLNVTFPLDTSMICRDRVSFHFTIKIEQVAK